MATKDLGSTPTTGADLLTNITGYNSVDFTDANELRTKVWSELVTRDAREKNVFAKFIGSEGSGKPIVEKTDLSAGGSDQVIFTTVAPIRGQGVRGEAILKTSTGKLKFGTFKVEVDLLRHAVSWTQVLKLMRFTGKTLDQLSAEVMSEWAARTEQDHLQYVLRNTCLKKTGNNLLSAYGASGALKYTEGLSTDIIQEAKQALIANGGQPMNTGGDVNQEIPGYLFFGPDACLRPLRSDPDYLEAITQADARGADNKLYSGSYAKWDNNIIANHNVIIDTASGRQGSPLAPICISPTDLSTKTAFVSNTSQSNGVADHLGLEEAAPLSTFDTFANFPGAQVSIPGGGGEFLDDSAPVVPLETDQYVLIIGADKTKWAVHAVEAYKNCAVSGTSGYAAGLSHCLVANRVDITGAVGNGVTIVGPLTIIPCNAIGTPIGHCLAMGEGALYMARGAVTNEQIFHYDDFANSGNDAHLSAVGVQSVYGMAAYQDTDSRIPGVVLVEAVRQVPGWTITQ